MAVPGAGSIVIEYDSSPGGSLTDITDYVQSEFVLGVLEVIQDIKALGDSTPQKASSGNVEMPEIIFEGPWDTGTGKPEDVFRLQDGDKSPYGETRSLRVTLDSRVQLDVETRLVDYKRIRRYPGALRYRSVIQPVGDLTETDL